MHNTAYRLVIFTGALVVAAGGRDAQPRARNAHETVEAFVSAIVTDKTSETNALKDGSLLEERIDGLKQQFPQKKILLEYVYASESGEKQEAIAFTESVSTKEPQPDGLQEGQLVFTLAKKEKNWKVADVQFKRRDAAYEFGERFLAKFPDAKLVRPRIGEDEDIVEFTSRDYLLRQIVAQCPGGPRQPPESKTTVEQVLKDIPRCRTVSKMLTHYRQEKNVPRRAALLWLLALSGDPRGAVAVGEALDDNSFLAVDCVGYLYIPAVSGGSEAQIEAAHNWWAANQANLRAKAKELQKREVKPEKPSP